MSDKGSAVDTADTEPAAVGAGAELKRAREASGLSIEEVSTDLRIEAHLLRALERDDYAIIGAPVFAKGYIRQYANRLGIDPAPLVERYLDSIGHAEVQVEPSRTIKLQDSQQSTLFALALIVLALIVVSLLVWWYREQSSDDVTPRAADVPAAEPRSLPFPETSDPRPGGAAAGGAARAADPGVAGGDAALDGPAAIGEESALPEAPAADDPQAAEAGPPPGANGPNASAAEAVPGAAAAAGDPGARAASTVPNDADAATDSTDSGVAGNAPGAGNAAAAVGTASGPEVELVFAEDCWVEITDADDRQLLYGLLTAGSRRIVSGTPPIDIFLGNADATAIRVDGRDFTVPRTARRGNLARFAIPARTD